MKLTVYDPKGDMVFEGSPLSQGVISKDIPEPVYSYLVSSWTAWSRRRPDAAFEDYWKDYVAHRLPTSLGIAYQGYVAKVET